MTTAEPYDAWYFANCCGVAYGRNEHWLTFFSRIAERIVADIAPRTVLDAGCAMGLLVEALRDRGVDAHGIDVSEYALRQAREDIRPYVRNASVTDPLPQRYDLIVCIEVLEHLPEASARAATENFASHTDDVLFSSTPSDFSEVTHVTVKPPEWWAERFARQELFRDVDFDANFITPWAARFRRGAFPLAQVIAAYERRLWQLSQEISGTRATLAQLQHASREAENASARIAALETQIEALEVRTKEEREAFETMRIRHDDASRELAEVRSALAELLGTKTFRYTQLVRAGWGRMRSARRDQ